MSLDSTKFCLFCYKITGSSADSIKSSVSSIKWFYELLGRFVGDSKLNDLLVNTEKIFGSSMNCCKKCQVKLDEFCAVYDQIKCLELQLELILNTLIDTVNVTNRIPSRCTNLTELFQKVFGTERKTKTTEALRNLRQNIVKAGHIRSKKSKPRIQVYSTKVTDRQSFKKITRHLDIANTDISKNQRVFANLNTSKNPTDVSSSEPILNAPDHQSRKKYNLNEHPISENLSSIINESESSSKIYKNSSTQTVSTINNPQQHTFRVHQASKNSMDDNCKSNGTDVSNNEKISSEDYDNRDDLETNQLEKRIKTETDIDEPKAPEKEKGTIKVYSNGKLERFRVSGGKWARQCDECNIWVEDRKALYAHKRKSHRDPVKCPMCEKSYQLIFELNRHISAIHSDSQYAADFRTKCKARKPRTKNRTWHDKQ